MTTSLKSVSIVTYYRPDNSDMLWFEFQENYYKKYDVFEIIGTSLMFEVLSRPIQILEETAWLVPAITVDNYILPLHNKLNNLQTRFFYNKFMNTISNAPISIKNPSTVFTLLPNCYKN